MLIRFCKNKKIEKILAIMLVITITFANLAFLGKNLISYAFEEDLEKQGIDTQHANVKFDAYFSDDGGTNVHSVVFDATNNIPKMNLYLAVRKVGYLKEAYIDFRDESNGTNTNYEITSDSVNTALVQNVNTSMKTISLNYINCGTEAVIEMPIKFDFTELTEINKIKQNSLVTLRGLYVDENGKETEISKTIKLNIGYDLETELSIEQAITKYVPYNYAGKSGLIMQLAIKAKQNNEYKALPVKETELKIKVPEIAENLPEKITVSSNSTMATNGNKIEFTSEDWEYNEEEKIITINTKGYEENGIAWSGVGTDEYFVTYMYSSEVYESVVENEIALHCEVEGEMSLYTIEGIVSKTATSAGDVVLSQKVGDIVTYNIDAIESEISKGKMYANYNSEEKMHDTEYNSTIKVNVSNSEIVDEICMSLGADDFTSEENTYTTKIGGEYYTTYKQITIEKSKMQKILGEDGIINIYDNYSNIYTINRETEDIEGRYIINFVDEVGELTVKTSKPVEDGILELDTTKIISKDLIYSKDQVKQFENLKVNINGYAGVGVSDDLSQKEYTTSQTAEDIITLTETSTNAKFEISNTSLTSMAENKNIEMKILLNNNSETSDLYKNAVFTIILPKYIEDIDITGGNILYTNGLEIDYVERNYTENGIVLKVFTKGAEKDFSDGVFTNGTNIVLNTTIKVNMLTPNISDKIVLDYTNESAISYVNGENGYGTDEVEINFVAPEEMVTFNTVLTSGTEFTSLEGNEQTAKLEILDAEKIATMKISILNKYSNACNNIRILGRTPFIGNKSISTGTDLGTTFNAKLVSAINTNGINAVVYYSSNESATENIEDISNAWTTDWTTLDSVKSYLVILQNYEMQPGQIIELAYDCEIPENLEHNESAYGTYAVYFDSVSEYVAQKSTEATKVGLTTGVGANLETFTKVIYQGNEINQETAVREYQYITYKTTVRNTGTVDAMEVKLAANIQNAVIVDEQALTETSIEYMLGEIPAGEERTVEYTVKVNNIGSLGDNYRVINDTIVTAENFEGELKKQVSNEIKEAELIVSTLTNFEEGMFNNGVELSLSVTVNNISGKDLTNLVITEYIPNGLKYLPKESISGNTISYDEETRILTIKINKLESYSNAGELINLITELPTGVGKIETINIANVTADDIDKYQSNGVKVNVYGPVLQLEMSSNLTNGSYIKEGSPIELTVVAKNIGEAVATTSSINIVLPKELRATEAYYYNVAGEVKKLSKTTGNVYYVLTDIEKGESITMKIIANTKLYDNVGEAKIEIKSTAKASRVEEIQSNILTYTIEETGENTNPIDPNTPVEKTYKITGVAWLDENEDGKKDSNEKLLEGIDVMLIDANTGVIVTDKTNGTLKKAKTSSNGVYTFTNLPNGKYIVVFEYNSAYYDITEYKKEGIQDDMSSKAIESKINKDGKIVVAGITDAIVISNSSKANVNIGLVVKPKFDLSLEKTISKMTVENASGTKSYDFTNAKLAKVEIPGKYLNNSKVYVEYKIKVKNEGEVAGYASKIVDYISPDFTFDKNNNSTWYMGKDGNLYNESLAKTILNPGEEKELTLTLLKTMTEDNTGIVSNIAEIYEVYNEQNLPDQDSKEANKAQGEDDLSSADVLISVKTGQTAIYITITLISIAIIAIGVYFINKNVLKGGKI